MYRHIFFDLDHTLWDFDRNSKEVLLHLFEKHQMDMHKIEFELFLQAHYQTTRQLWTLYNQNQIDQQKLREIRFPMIFEKLGISIEAINHKLLSEEYLYLTPRQPHLLPYALEVLEYLQKNYQLHIITNGFPEIQDLKLSSGGIQHFFPFVFTSAQSGFQKPHKEIFLHALATTQARVEESLMIGDNYETDIMGAQNAGLDAVFLNPQKTKFEDYKGKEITCLSELLDYL
jgi:putative hydrolase of the HAD superfamily